MDVYYDEAGTVLGEAWSVMHCSSADNHTPHPHKPKFTIYGPYMCSGFPTVKLFDAPPRKPVN